VIDPQPWRTAARVLEQTGAIGHHGLAQIDRGHRPRKAARGKPEPQRLRHGHVLLQREPELRGHGLTGHIVVGWTEPAAHDHEIGARQGRTNRQRELASVVTGHHLQNDFDAESVQLACDEE
jgi:hypothetical protein